MRVRFTLPSIAAADAKSPRWHALTNAVEEEQLTNSSSSRRGPARRSGDSLFSLAQLTDFRVWRTLPDVVATERETYLSAHDFREVFAMDREEFAKLPKWRRDYLKKKHSLF